MNMKWDQNNYLTKMLRSCENENIKQWNILKPHVENELRSLLLMIEWLIQMKSAGEINTEQARIHIDIQKNSMRTRLMSLPGVSMIESEHLINNAIDSVRKELYNQIEWIIL